MADTFRDPRVAGSLDAIGDELDRIGANVEDAKQEATRRDREQRAREERRGRTPARPGRGAEPPTLDEQVRARQEAEGTARAQERAADAQERGKRAAEQTARQERFITESAGKRSAIVRDTVTGEQIGPRFRGGLPKDAPDVQAQRAATRAAGEYAANLNRAKDAVEGVGKELIRHPQYFGRGQVFTPTTGPAAGPVRREFQFAARQPPGAVGAAEERLAAAQQAASAAKKAQKVAVDKGTRAEVVAANQQLEITAQEVAASKQALAAVRQQTIARQADAARLRALGSAAGPNPLLRQIAAFDRAGQRQIELFDKLYPHTRPTPPPTPPRLPTTGFGLPGAEEARAAAGGTLGGTGVGAAGPIRETGQAAETAGRQVRTYNEALSFSAREADLAANAARRNGALTTEFIEAAARGRTTIRELGFQVGATIGKFAGWTAAATAVFGAAAAIAELGRGAIDTAEGVNNLTRIIPTLDKQAAASGIQDLAQQFNLPIGDVADAAYGISKVFGNIRDPAEALQATLKGTASVLFAMKVGELDVATATRYLTGIINGFQLDADELPDLFDAINQAQNRFGGNVGQITQGVAQAAGTFSSAGGSYRELIALIQTGSRVTGRTGAEIGTALRRSAEIYQRPERRQTILDLLGIDPRESTITEVIERAQQVVRGAAPALQSQIAKAISTPELASGRILPILRSGALYREITAGISPSEAKGSAERELERALRGPREQIARLRTDLQSLGSELAQSGFLAPFETLLKVLDATLDVATKLIEIFGGLPDLLKAAVAYALPLGAALGVARRFDVGGGRGIFGRSAGATTRANIITGLDAERQAVGGERIARATELRSTSLRVERIDRELATLLGDEEETVARRAALSDRRQVLVRQMFDAEDDITALHAQERQVLRQRQAVIRQRFRSEASVIAAYQAEGGFYQQPVLGRPFPGGPVPAGGGVGGPLEETPGGVVLPPGVGRDFEKGEKAAKDAARANSRLVQRAERFNASMSGLGRSGRALGSAAEKGARAASAVGGELASAARGLTGAGAGLAAAFGPLDAVILALIAFGTLAEMLHQQEQQVQDQAQRLNDAIGPRTRAVEIKKTQDYIDSAGAKIIGGFQEVENVAVGLAKFTAGISTQGTDAFGGIDQILRGADTPREEAIRANRAARERQRRQRRAQRQGRLYYQGQIRQELRADFEGADTDAERQEAIEKAQRLYRESLFKQSKKLRKRPRARAEAAITRDLIAQLRGEAAATATSVNAFRRQLDEVEDAASAEGFVNRLLARVSRRGILPNLGRVGAGLQKLRQLVVDSEGEERQKRLEQLMKLQDDSLSRIETIFQRQLDAGVSPQRARRRYLNATAFILFRVRTIEELRELQNRRRRIRALIRTAQQILNDIEDQAGRALSEVAGEALGRREGAATRRLNRLNQILSNLGPSPTRDDLNEYGDRRRDADERINQMLEQDQQDAESRLQEAISIFQSRQRNASARALIGANQGARLQRALSDAQAFLGFLRGQKGVDQATLLDAETAVFEAQDAYAQYLQEQAQALVRARSAFAQSRTTDPVKQALIRLREAQQLVQFAETPAERLEALAEVNNRRREYEQTKQQDRVDEQAFLFDIGKITQEQYAAWIRRFLRAHKTLRRTNRELFRQLRRTLHQLSQETEQDLDLQVGDIRLPTLYDVRRLVRQGTRTAPQGVVQQSNQFQIDGSQDPEATAAAVGSVLRTSTKSGLRAAGLTG